jgi:hypothetical protein
MGGYLSPVGDAYKKAGLASSTHRYLLVLPSFQTSANKFRLRMCELAGTTTKVCPNQTHTDIPTPQFVKHRIG